MSVNVKTSTNDVGSAGVGVLLGVGVVVGGLLYTSLGSAAQFRNVARASLLLASVIMAVVLYLMLTNFDSFMTTVQTNQLVALTLACVVAANVAVHGLVELGIVTARS